MPNYHLNCAYFEQFTILKWIFNDNLFNCTSSRLLRKLESCDESFFLYPHSSSAPSFDPAEREAALTVQMSCSPGGAGVSNANTGDTHCSEDVARIRRGGMSLSERQDQKVALGQKNFGELSHLSNFSYF